MEILIANDADSALIADVAAADVALTIRAADAAKFPNPAAGTQAFYATLERKNTGEREIVLVTARAANVFTVTRAQDGSAALSFKAGDLIGLRQNKAAIDAYLAQQAAYLPQKNALWGGDFGTNPWQDGTNFVNPGTGSYSADNMRLDYVTAATVTVSKLADAPTVAQAGRLLTHCMQVDVTGADAAVAAGDFYLHTMFVEGYDWMTYAQRALALRFWHKHSKVGTYCVAMRNDGNDRTLIMEYQQAVANTWEEAIIDLPASPAAGTWNYANGRGLQACFTLMAGAAVQAAGGAWIASGAIATANQVNALDAIGNKFRLADVRLGAGAAAYARFLRRNEDEEILKAQRYFWLPDTNTATIGFPAVLLGSNTARTSLRLPVRMRIVPSIAGSVPANVNVNYSAGNVAGNALTYFGGVDGGAFDVTVAGAPFTAGQAASVGVTNKGLVLSARF